MQCRVDTGTCSSSAVTGLFLNVVAAEVSRSKSDSQRCCWFVYVPTCESLVGRALSREDCLVCSVSGRSCWGRATCAAGSVEVDPCRLARGTNLWNDGPNLPLNLSSLGHFILSFYFFGESTVFGSFLDLSPGNLVNLGRNRKPCRFPFGISPLWVFVWGDLANGSCCLNIPMLLADR